MKEQELSKLGNKDFINKDTDKYTCEVSEQLIEAKVNIKHWAHTIFTTRDSGREAEGERARAARAGNSENLSG